MSKELAIRLLRAHRDDIAREILAHVDRVAPTMARIDRRARSSSVAFAADAAAAALEGGTTKEVSALLRNTIRLRLAGGVSREDMIATTHTYLPSIRAVFVAKHPRLDEALAAYEAVEQTALPLVVELARVVVRFDPTDADDDEPTNPSGKRPAPRARASTPAHPFRSSESSDGE